MPPRVAADILKQSNLDDVGLHILSSFVHEIKKLFVFLTLTIGPQNSLRSKLGVVGFLVDGAFFCFLEVD